MASIKKNFIYNAILTMSGYIFPLIVYPYASRILGVSNMGACNFVDSIVEYFTIISMMGMNTIGIREIAKCRDNQEKLNKTFSELFSLNTITTIIAVIALIISTFLIPKFYAYRDFLYIGAGKLFFNYLLINWFFQGLENFKYITARTIFVKILFVLAVFTLVKSPSDVKLYYLLVALTWAGNGIINMVYSKKFVKFKFTFKTSKLITQSFVLLGIYWCMNSMYTTLNVTYLGFVSNDTEVGYYTTAYKLLLVIMAMFTALTSVMVPRISQSLSTSKNNDYTEITTLLSKAISALILFSIPLVFFVIPFSKELIQLMSGPGYEGAVLPLQIMTPLFFLIGYDQIIVLQTLLPIGKDKIILKNSFLAALVGISANLALTTFWGKIGSSFVLILAEITVLASSQICVSKFIGLKFPYKALNKYIVTFSPIIFICYGIKYFITPYVISLLSGALITFLYVVFVSLTLLKDNILANIINNIFHRNGQKNSFN